MATHRCKNHTSRSIETQVMGDSMMQHICEMFENTNDTFRLTDITGSYTGNDIKQYANHFSAVLKNEGIKSADRVILICNDCIYYLVGMLATFKLNAIVVPVSTTVPDKTLLEVIQIVKPACICIQDKTIGEKINKLDLRDTKTINIVLNKPHLFINEKQNFANLASNIAFILLSSGTTGKRKGIALTHSAICRNLESIADYMKPNANDRFLVLKEFTHVSTLVGEILMAIYAGVKLFVPPVRCTVGKQIKYIEKYQPTMVFLNPVLLEQLTRYIKAQNIRISPLTIYTSGAILTPEQAYETSQILTNCKIYNVYGLTEAGPRVAAQTDENRNKYGSVGKAILNTKIKILDPSSLEETQKNSIGEIYIKNESLMQGYVYDNYKIEKINQSEYLKTGDLGYFDQDGDLFITGRVDDIVNVAGNNVNLNTVELAVKKTGLVKHCAIFGVPDSLLITRIICLVEADEVANLRAKSLIQSCSKFLYPYEMPKEFITCKKIPVSDVGKVSRYTLSQMYELSKIQYTKLPY